MSGWILKLIMNVVWSLVPFCWKLCRSCLINSVQKFLTSWCCLNSVWTDCRTLAVLQASLLWFENCNEKPLQVLPVACSAMHVAAQSIASACAQKRGKPQGSRCNPKGLDATSPWDQFPFSPDSWFGKFLEFVQGYMLLGQQSLTYFGKFGWIGPCCSDCPCRDSRHMLDQWKSILRRCVHSYWATLGDSYIDTARIPTEY